jgi:low temperature requirement protein LtrA
MYMEINRNMLDKGLATGRSIFTEIYRMGFTFISISGLLRISSLIWATSLLHDQKTVLLMQCVALV